MLCMVHPSCWRILLLHNTKTCGWGQGSSVLLDAVTIHAETPGGLCSQLAQLAGNALRNLKLAERSSGRPGLPQENTRISISSKWNMTFERSVSHAAGSQLPRRRGLGTLARLGTSSPVSWLSANQPLAMTIQARLVFSPRDLLMISSRSNPKKAKQRESKNHSERRWKMAGEYREHSRCGCRGHWTIPGCESGLFSFCGRMMRVLVTYSISKCDFSILFHHSTESPGE
ncbi:hypothetical protein CONLIGDRAFT_252897 [Coniochaeta ligniaria NRRL 30616]|uniref:Uncharacterized protein n=1 Tax=Coniochaeta ligniaria NRRL 30616 TaxID=1408157 RepID=A0A1J7JFK4_9PEZI|nr:hypothetical protein CONLIGDRAFT_252897 [Coniochaeta ligniaria NRRL 30616]